MVYNSMHMSNEYLNETQTWGEAINEWLVTEEPVVSVSEYYTVHYTVDSAHEATILAISDSQATVLWENAAASWNAPAKHARGNVFYESTDWYEWTGPNYLK